MSNDQNKPEDPGASDNQDEQRPIHPRSRLCPGLSRRSFIRAVGAVPAALLLSQCGDDENPTAGGGGSLPDGSVPDGGGGGSGLDGGDSGTDIDVAIGQADSYDSALVRPQLENLLDMLGFASRISNGDRVVIKINLTGPTSQDGQGTGPERYLTNPAVVRALCELLLDAGAGELYIVEGIFSANSFSYWGWDTVASAVGATLVNLNDPAPYGDFGTVQVPSHLVYDSFQLNRILHDTDHFISVAKLKCHGNCGVTGASKNLVGLTPIGLYDDTGQHSMRTNLHTDPYNQRLPSIVVDLCRARPIDFCIIDGIMTAEGGEGPWQPHFNAVQPHILIAGNNHVATDAVATATMGFDPTAEYPNTPFNNAVNHIALAAAGGLGTNLLSQIRVGGASIEDVQVNFTPA